MMKSICETTPTPATSTGSKGPNDYSNWTFPATPKFGTIKEGIKKITAKYSCLPNVNLKKFHSVIVTGAGTSPTTTSHHHHNK